MHEGKHYMVEDSKCVMEDSLKGMSCTVNWEND